ncbi:MAG: hypothetical protein H6Q01_1112 [Acidobacteria bacterium]|jgi:predicted transcriptional regulator|nr:hypothetical protein [Acidobacteriota bacterium]
MKTTLSLDDALMRAVSEFAAQSGRTPAEVAEEALRDYVWREVERHEGHVSLD